jgi:hypothetical protein
MGKMIVNQMMSIAELEAQLTSERIKSTFDYKIQQGEIVSGKVPFGFSIQNKSNRGKSMIHNPEAPILKDIFNYFAKCSNLSKTIDYMFGTYNIEITMQGLKKMLKNKKYIGEHRDNIDFCEPILTKKLFYTVQRLLNKNLKQNSKKTYLFSGLIKCAECGYGYGGSSSTSKYMNKNNELVIKTYKNYRCSAYRNKRNVCNNKHMLNELKLEPQMLSLIKPEFEKYVIGQSSNELNNKETKSSIEQLNNKINRLKIAFVNGFIEIDEYRSDRESLLKQIERLSSTPKIIKQEFVEFILSDRFEEIYELSTDEEKQAIWRSIIETIIVGSEGNIKINFL